MMAMPGTVQSVSFSTYRRNTIRLDRPLPLRLLPEWGRITAAGQEPAGENDSINYSSHPPRQHGAPKSILQAWFGAVAVKRSSRCHNAFLLRCGLFFNARPSSADTPDASQHSSLRGSAARGSCDTRNAPCSVRSRVSSSATPSMVPDVPGSDTYLAPSEEPGRHAARSPGNDRADDRPSDGDPKASELFS
jgi:hypothetical protein